MKMISNDLRSSCRSLLLGAYQDSAGGGTHYDSIFHDIIDNSDVVATIPIYGDYKLTVNLWETDRADVYEPSFYTHYGSAQQSADEGYCQNYYFPQYRIVHAVFVAWNGDTPLYAQLSGSFLYFTQSYSFVDVRESNDVGLPYEWYVYQVNKEEYIKGSAALTSEIDHFEFRFDTWSDNVQYFTDYIYPCDSSGNHIGMVFTLKTKDRTYSAERPQTEWTNPETGITSTISDSTKIPSIKLKSSSERSHAMGISNNIRLFIGNPYGTFSDFDTNKQLIAAHGEIVRAICLANGMDYRMAPLLLPESEEST